MNRYRDEKKAKKKLLKYGCMQNTFQALSKAYTLLKACQLPKRYAGTKHRTSQALESHNSSSFPCKLHWVHASERHEHGKVDLAQLTSVQSFRLMEEESVCIKHCRDQSHLTTDHSPAFLLPNTLFFSLRLKLILLHFQYMQTKLLLPSTKYAEATYSCHFYGFK